MTPINPSAALQARITEYLSNGGLFNPEMANHAAVRDLLIDCRAALQGSGSPSEAEDGFTVSTGKVSREKALAAASELEAAIGEVLNGQRKPGKLPVEPMCHLIKFARASLDTSASRTEPSEEVTRLRRFAQNVIDSLATGAPLAVEAAAALSIRFIDDPASASRTEPGETICRYCNEPAIGWTEAEAKRGRKEQPGLTTFHCRMAAD